MDIVVGYYIFQKINSYDNTKIVIGWVERTLKMPISLKVTQNPVRLFMKNPKVHPLTTSLKATPADNPEGHTCRQP